MGQLAGIGGQPSGLGNYLMPSQAKQYLPAVGNGLPQVTPGVWTPPRTAVPGLNPQSAIPGTTWQAAAQPAYMQAQVGTPSPYSAPRLPSSSDSMIRTGNWSGGVDSGNASTFIPSVEMAQKLLALTRR